MHLKTPFVKILNFVSYHCQLCCEFNKLIIDNCPLILVILADECTLRKSFKMVKFYYYFDQCRMRSAFMGYYNPSVAYTLSGHRIGVLVLINAFSDRKIKVFLLKI